MSNSRTMMASILILSHPLSTDADEENMQQRAGILEYRHCDGTQETALLVKGLESNIRRELPSIGKAKNLQDISLGNASGECREEPSACTNAPHMSSDLGIVGNPIALFSRGRVGYPKNMHGHGKSARATFVLPDLD
jgi:hypothetical protein